MKYNFKISIYRAYKLKKRILFLLCLCFSTLYGYGKEFRLISLDNFEQHEGLKFVNKKGAHNLNLRKYYLNSSKSVPKSNFVHFFSTKADTSKAYKKSILTISFLEQETDTLVFIEKDDSSTNGFKYSFIPNDPQSFPGLTAAIFNNMKKTVLIKMGDAIIKIAPQSQKFIPLPKNKKGYFDEKVVFATQKLDKSIDYFYSSFWRVYNSEKKLCFIDMNEATDEHKLTEITFK